MARDNAFLNHHHIIYRLTISNDILIWQVDSGLNVGYEIANELISSLIERLVEKVEKVGYKFPEKSLNKLMAKPWLELVEEFSILDAAEIKVKRFLCELFDGVIQLLTEVLWPCFLKNSYPVFNFFLPVIDDVLNRDV